MKAFINDVLTNFIEFLSDVIFINEVCYFYISITIQKSNFRIGGVIKVANAVNQLLKKNLILTSNTIEIRILLFGEYKKS